MSTYIHGIAASVAIDTAAESLNIEGLDDSTLANSVFNWEHKSDIPAQVVGKILKVKKIFQEADCEDDAQRKFWDMIKMPYLYCFGRLFDDNQPSAQELAAIFQDDAQHPNENKIMGFSIEGNKLNKDGGSITNSIGRKIAITVTPANKTCVAELFKSDSIEKDDLEGLFDPPEEMTKAEIKPLGTTSTGKPVNSTGHLSTYSQGFNEKEHHEAAGMHYKAFENAKSPAVKNHHMRQSQFHTALANKKPSYQSEKSPPKGQTPVNPQTTKQYNTIPGKREPMEKTLAASMPSSAPGEMVDGAALQMVEHKVKKSKKLCKKHADMHKSIEPKLAKTEKWLSRAEQEYQIWPKKDEFRAFMQKSNPGMALGEIDAIGQTVALKESIANEKKLASLDKALTFGDGKAATRVSPENDATPKPLPKEFENHNKSVKGVEHTEIAHVQPHYDGKSADTLYTAAGHKLEGHPKGKFKVGDKVTASSHIMGTHALEHGHKKVD